LANLFGKDSKYYSIPENTAIGRVRFVKKEAGGSEIFFKSTYPENNLYEPKIFLLAVTRITNNPN
jgi:hypothetical protein